MYTKKHLTVYKNHKYIQTCSCCTVCFHLMDLVQSTSQKLDDVINELLDKQLEVTMNCQNSLSKEQGN